MENEIIKTINDHQLVNINDKFYLTHYQKDVLDKFHIPYQDVNNMEELLYYFNDIYDDEEFEELSKVAEEISEFNYYNNTHK